MKPPALDMNHDENPMPIHAMEIAHRKDDAFFLFQDIFVHWSGRKITAAAPYYGDDIDWEELGIDLEDIVMVLGDTRIRGRYVPHRLDSRQPAILFDFEDPALTEQIETREALSFDIIAGAHRQPFTISTAIPPAHGVAMSVIVRNENRWLDYYLDYYLNCMAVDHIYVYDNRTDDREALLKLLSPYLARELVTYIPWHYRWRNRIDHKQIGQPSQQSHTLNRFGNTTWIGFFDVDEFLRIPGKTLPEFLEDYSTIETDGLSFGMRWFMYQGELSLDQIDNPLFSMFHSKRDALGRKRQKLVAAANVRFLRFHRLEEGKREHAVPDDDIFFHHYHIRPARFEEGKAEQGTTVDHYMLQFSQLIRSNLSHRTRNASIPKTVRQWIAHVELALARAERYDSKLEDDVLSIDGMCGSCNRHFLNNLCNFEGASYLEIGSQAGASLCSAIYKNSVRATAIDNWSQFDRPRDRFSTNLQKFMGDSDVRVVDTDCFSVYPDDLGRFHTLFYDGEHSKESHHKAITRFYPCLEDLGVIVVDDWNWQQVREGTREALATLDANIVFEKEIRLPQEALVDMPRHAGRKTWWNGMYVAVLQRRPASALLVSQTSPADAPSMTATTRIIVFSKDRACQLEALLRSMEKCLAIPHTTTVQYTATNDEFELGYQRLRAGYPDVTWVRESNFRADLLALLGSIDPDDHLMFLVDDIVFVRRYEGAETLAALRNEPDVLCVSLRLGEDIRWCHPRQAPTTPPDLSNLRWKWREASSGYWNYPMSVDGNIYRAGDLLEHIPTIRFESPGTLEAAMQTITPDRPLMICNRSPVLVNLALNRVQTAYNNPHGDMPAEDLNREFLDGQVIDTDAIAQGRYESCHIEPPIAFVGSSPRRRHLDLRDITCYVINCEDATDRREFMAAQLSDRGLPFEFVPGIPTTPKYVGQGLAHLRVLKRDDVRVPFVIMEDDCELTNAFTPVLDLAGEADAYYLGVSKFGLATPGKMSWGAWEEVRTTRFDDNCLRVENMLSRHAILVLTDRFRQAAIQCSLDALAHPEECYPGDVGYATLQSRYLVLTPRRPMCHQSERFSQSYLSTRESLLQTTPITDSDRPTLKRVFITGMNYDAHKQKNSVPHPKTFAWTTLAEDATSDTRVYANAAIQRQVSHPDDHRGRKIAWIQESPAIAESFQFNSFIRANVLRVARAFDAVLMSDRSMCALHEKFHWHPPGANLSWIREEDFGMYEKNKLVSMFISPKKSLPGHHLRHQIAAKYRRHIDLYGGPLGSKHLPEKYDGLVPYMFNIAMENCKVSLYYTEKLIDCFATGTVPVYWGTPDIGEFFDMKGVILLDDRFDVRSLTAERYEAMLPAVRSNLERARNLESSFDMLYRMYIKNDE